MSRSICEVLAAAAARLSRLGPGQAYDELVAGALVVDTRPQAQRARDGEVAGALVLERNHLEWRLDPAREARVPEATDHDVRVVVLCDEGYSSVLAAVSLQGLGLHRATDVEGGFQAWRAAGLPVVSSLTPAGARVSGYG